MNYDTNCLFCKIIKGEIPSGKVYEDDSCYAFRDINPMTPVHILVVPRAHIASADCITKDNSHFIGAIFEAIPKIASLAGLDNGYRIVSNVGNDGCQSIGHIHFHILGGRKLPESLG